MKRKTEVLELEDVIVTSEALAFEASEDLLPEVMQIVSSVFETVGPMLSSGDLKGDMDISKLIPVLGVLAGQIGGGKLRRLAPKILAGTTIVMPDPSAPTDKINLHLVKSEDRTMCFDARPDLYFVILYFAGKVTFGRFFPAKGLLGKKAPPATV